ncbi:sensor histidine kinase [Streptomyces sp. NPDC090445]|uniref:sensor histidine kinase n=1 Tax=Streptomyces sp. NPDC090445 TaxID=3365963 RepID=UPI00380A9232
MPEIGDVLTKVQQIFNVTASQKRMACLIAPVPLGMLDALLVHGGDVGVGLGMGLGAAVVMLARRRFPVVTLLATLPGMYLGYVWIAPIIALYTVASLRRPPGLLALTGALFAVAHFLPFPVGGLAEHSAREIALAAVDTLGATVIPLGLGLLARTRRELAANLGELRGSQARERRLLTDRVLAEERARLAREMHDVVAHQVGLINLQAGALQVISTDPGAQEGARTIRELSGRTLDELRYMVGVLRSAEAGDPALQAQLADVPRLIGQSGLDIAYRNDVPQGTYLPEGVERAAYRTVQEALTNAGRYAPAAHIQVVLGLEGDGEALRVEVRNGPSEQRGERPCRAGGGYGLVGLKERAHSVGGTLEAHPTSDRGFLVTARLPVS